MRNLLLEDTSRASMISDWCLFNSGSTKYIVIQEDILALLIFADRQKPKLKG